MKKTTLIAVLTGLFVALLIGVTVASTVNREISLRKQVEAQQQVCEAYYDKMWKIIQQKAEVTDQYKEAFKEIYPKLIEGRYGDEKGGTLMKWITESNPTFDVSLYKDLMQSIEAERAGFFAEQEQLIDLGREHSTFKSQFPSSLIVGSKPDIKIIVVSSTKTKQAMSTGIDNDVMLFGKK